MTLNSLVRRIVLVFKLPFKVVLYKVTRKLRGSSTSFFLHLRDRHLATYGALPQCIESAKFALRFESADPLLQGPVDTVLAISNHYLLHRFDLLGSGWLQVRHGMQCYGLEGHIYNSGKAVVVDTKGEWLRTRINHANLVHAQFVWSLITPGYIPIDWHLDFKSGYRWSENIWYKDIRFGNLLGVDVKVPWELARMQHLPQLALAHALAVKGTEGFQPPGIYVLEFRNQILDFTASNPPRYGVNWSCTMDVSIRIANWLMAYDLLSAAEAVFDEEFDRVFRLSIYQHGQHIINNLEWHVDLRANHYLSNLVGLLYVAAYLPCSDEIDAWLAFAVQELIVEVKLQFYEDGGNFEASTAYHRLSAELVVYATALIVGLPEAKRKALASYDHKIIKGVPKLNPAPIKMFAVTGSKAESPFPDWYWQRLEKMAEFTNSILRPDNLSPQIGDNDSGRLFKMCPKYDFLTVMAAKHRYLNLKNYDALPDTDAYQLEIHNDHRHLIAAVNGLIWRKDFAKVSEEFSLETFVIRSLAGNIQVSARTPNTNSGESFEIQSLDPGYNEIRSIQGMQSYRFTGGDASSLRTHLHCEAYPQFGIYVYKSECLYMVVRCGQIGLNGLGAHAHNDPLSVEIWINGRPIIVDPGSYIYTPLPERRNTFRSIQAHFAPYFRGYESGSLDFGVFALGNEAKAKCTAFSKHLFSGNYQCGANTIFRTVSITDHSVDIVDWSNSSEQSLCRLDQEHIKDGITQFSDGYGRVSIGVDNLAK